MIVDTSFPADLSEIKDASILANELGFDGIFAAEVKSDPFVASAVASQHAPGMDLGTKIAVAFARTPMTTAYAAHGLNELSGGRFHLGLGTQVRAHITRRFSMPWSQPTVRMREYVVAMKEIWESWRTNEPLAFKGEFYEHSLMTEYFVPETRTQSAPPVWLASVGPRMTDPDEVKRLIRAHPWATIVSATTGRGLVASHYPVLLDETADGIVLHGFWTREYMDKVMMPAIDRGLEKGGRTRDDLAITGGGFLITGATAEELAKKRELIRYQVAFYGSTPSYRPVWEAHDMGELGDRLHTLSIEKSADRWQRMTSLISDEVLDLYAVTAEPANVGTALLARHGDYADRISIPALVGDPDVWSKTIATLRAGGDRTAQ